MWDYEYVWISWISECSKKIWISEYSKIWISEYSKIWMSEYLKIWIPEYKHHRTEQRTPAADETPSTETWGICLWSGTPSTNVCGFGRTIDSCPGPDPRRVESTRTESKLKSKSSVKINHWDSEVAAHEWEISKGRDRSSVGGGIGF